MSVIIVCMLVRMAVDLDIFGDLRYSQVRRKVEIIVECFFFFLASISLVVLYRNFTKCAKPYISIEERQ